MVSVEHLALCPVQFTINPLLSPPGALYISSPFVGGGGGGGGAGPLRETWGLVRDGVSLHFPPGVNTTPIFFRNRINNNNNNNNNNREGSGRTSLDSTAIDALLIVFILFYFFKQLKETFEF